MTLLILGLALWWAAHLFKRIAPRPRARLGDGGKALVALAVLGSVVLMVLGYRAADFVPLWYPPAWLVHVNNLLMVLAFFLYAADGTGMGFARRMRHPQLTGFKTWACWPCGSGQGRSSCGRATPSCLRGCRRQTGLPG